MLSAREHRVLPPFSSSALLLSEVEDLFEAGPSLASLRTEAQVPFVLRFSQAFVQGLSLLQLLLDVRLWSGSDKKSPVPSDSPLLQHREEFLNLIRCPAPKKLTQTPLIFQVCYLRPTSF